MNIALSCIFYNIDVRRNEGKAESRCQIMTVLCTMWFGLEQKRAHFVLSAVENRLLGASFEEFGVLGLRNDLYAGLTKQLAV